MNRRGFLTSIAGVATAGVAAKVLPTGYVESDETKLKRWFEPGAPPMKIDPQPVILQTRYRQSDMYMIDQGQDSIRQLHQEALNKWLRDKVDEAAFNVLSGKA